ncbi:MAG: hypothetical protein O3A80_00285 [bacterium]|nr:hypothetical protein [bacterium]MDA1293106.1 hypothetical protein [bacterium]
MLITQPAWAQEIASWMDSPHPINITPSHETCCIFFETLKEVYQVLQNKNVSDAKTLWKKRTGLELPSNEQVDSIRMFIPLYTFHSKTFDLLKQHSRYASNGKPNSGTLPLESRDQREVLDLILQLCSIGRTELANLITEKYQISEAEIEKWHRGIYVDDLNDEIMHEYQTDDKDDSDEDPNKKDVEITDAQKAAIGIREGGTGLVEGYKDKDGEPIFLQGSRHFAEGIELLLRMKFGNKIVDHWCWRDSRDKKNGMLIRRLQSGASIGNGESHVYKISDAEIAAILQDPHAIDDVTIAYLGLGTRHTNALDKVGIFTVGQLNGMTVADLSMKGLPATHNGGECKFIDILRIALKRLGRTLPDGDLMSAKKAVALRAEKRKKRKKAAKH